jgi:endonuclease YncB( thermonuclease family)
MSLASRIITALLGLALIVLFWPVVPIGFQQAWWARDQVITPVAPPSGPDKRLFTKPAVPVTKVEVPKASHAVSSSETPSAEASEPQPPASERTEGEQVAALNQKDATAAKPLKPTLYYRVVVRDGGTIESGGTVIVLAGIAARKAEAKCKDKKGTTWACGAQARAALMRLIRARAVSCDVPASGAPKSLTARCTLSGTDLSDWMVRQGWAEPKAPPEPALAKAADAARKKKIGIWR